MATTKLRTIRARANPLGVNSRLGCACLLAASWAVAAGAQAASGPAAASDALTWNGITLYGIIDIGLQYQTEGAAASDYFPAGTASPIQKFSNGSVTAVTPSNLSQSRIGLSGNEPLVGDWSGVFRLETFFNPQSGNISDALKSITLNNGKPVTQQSTNVDSSVAGQYFAGAAYAGFSSPSIGTFTFGRHVTLLADGVAKYDPLGASNAFSLIGFSGTTAGGGDTEDRRLDQSLKYTAKYGAVHLGALYQFSGASGTANTAVQAQIGGEFPGGGSLDVYYAQKYNAIAAAAITSAAQMAMLPVLGYSPSNSVTATISDNTTWGLMGAFRLATATISGGWEYITFKNPSSLTPAGSLTIGGYVLAFVNNAAFNKQKNLDVFWLGAKIGLNSQTDLMFAFYGYKQNSFATGAAAGCSNASNAACSGRENTASAVLDYRFSKRFDGYVGTFWSEVQDGLSNGYQNKSTLTSTLGIRFKF